jgi:hypothetical protein
VPRKDEPRFENQVRALSEQVQIISEKLGILTSEKQISTLISNNVILREKRVWVKKEDNLCLVAHNALKVLDTCLWYLDNGHSKHMTGDKNLLKKIKMGRGGKITYGDGRQSKVIGKGLVEITGFSGSQEALYVEGLKANLLSINQFCDNDIIVQFSKTECNIFDCNGKWLMGEESQITAMDCLVFPQSLKSSATR